MINNNALISDGVSPEQAQAYLNQALLKVKEEIQNDPAEQGYAGKNNQEIADLMNSPYSISHVVVDTIHEPEVTFRQAYEEVTKSYPYIGDNRIVKPDGSVVSGTTTLNTEFASIVSTANSKVHPARDVEKERTVKQDFAPRFNVITSGIPYINNSITADDIAQALAI